MVVSNLISCPYFLSSPGEPYLNSMSFVLTSVNTSAWTVRLISMACNEMLVFQLRQQHVHHSYTSQPGSIITHQRQEIDSFLARLSGMEVFHPTVTLGFISTKGDTLDQRLLCIHELSQANMFDYLKDHGEGKTAGVYIPER